MADISISLNNIRNTKSLYIEDLGVAFTVRKLGAGEELDLSDKMRRLSEIAKELQGVDFMKYDLTKEEDRKDIEKLEKRVSKLSDEIGEIKRFELSTYKRCFTDDANGENVEKLLNSLSDEDRGQLFKSIFDPITHVEAPESVETDEVASQPMTAEQAEQKALEEVK